MTIFTDILFWVMVVVCASTMIVPLVLCILSYLFNTWFREDHRSWCKDFMEFIFKQEGLEENGNYCGILFVFTGIIATILFIICNKHPETYNHPATGLVSLLILLIPAIIFVPRYVIDIFKGLQLNRKTGELERLAQLEKEFLALQEKVNEKS